MTSLIRDSLRPVQLDYVTPLFTADSKLVTSGSIWINSNDLTYTRYSGDVTTAGAYAAMTYIVA